MKKKNTFAWNLDRPLAVFDIEATGTNVRTDRIIELAIVRIMPDQSHTTSVFRINPGMPIPPEATKIHGIKDSDVANCPTFDRVAAQIQETFCGCDLAGYNLIRYDIPLLTEEMKRAGLVFALDGRRILDAQKIFHKREPRDLTAALAFYCGEMHFAAHGAESDANATIRVLEGQFEKYPDLPRDLNSLDQYCNPRDPSWVDYTGRLKWQDGEVAINFGKRKGELLKDIMEKDSSFIKWILRSDFPRDMQEIIRNAAEGKWPKKPVSDMSGGQDE